MIAKPRPGKPATMTFILFWKTKDRWQIVRGTDIADAVNNAGYGGGAMGALDYYQDITRFAKSKTCRRLFQEINSYGDFGYWWRREHVAKARSYFKIKDDQPFQNVVQSTRPREEGVKLTPFGLFLLNNLFKEPS